MKNVLIGVQARSTSTRLPNKAHLQVGGKAILQWVIDSAQAAARFLRQDSHFDLNVSVAVLVPEGDPIVSLYKSAPVLEGDEFDVLSRYVAAAKQFDAQLIVRLTADCIWIPPHHIKKHVNAALKQESDYTTNVHYRTHKEGWDCEVLSRRLLDYLDEKAESAHDREHVTTLVGAGKFFPFKMPDGRQSISHILNFYDESHIKTSIDTQEEYDEAEKIYNRYLKKRTEAKRNGFAMT